MTRTAKELAELLVLVLLVRRQRPHLRVRELRHGGSELLLGQLAVHEHVAQLGLLERLVDPDLVDRSEQGPEHAADC